MRGDVRKPGMTASLIVRVCAVSLPSRVLLLS